MSRRPPRPVPALPAGPDGVAGHRAERVALGGRQGLVRLGQRPCEGLLDPDQLVVEGQQVVGPVDVVADHVVRQALDERLDGGAGQVGDGAGEGADEVGGQPGHHDLRAAQPGDGGVDVEEARVRHPLGSADVVRA